MLYYFVSYWLVSAWIEASLSSYYVCASLFFSSHSVYVTTAATTVVYASLCWFSVITAG